MFDNIAPAYDRLNSLLSFGLDSLWRRRVVKMATQRGAVHAIDVATGTADLAIDLARRSGAEVVGVDLSEAMIEIGRRKVERAGLGDRIRLIAGDAENLPLEDCSADCLTVAFGVRNFQDMEAGLRQMHRVLMPGGSCYVLEFSVPDGVIFAPLFRFYFHRILPVIGGVVSGDRKAYEYLPCSVDEFPSREKFESMMRGAGFDEVKSVKLMFGVAYIYVGVKKLGE